MLKAIVKTMLTLAVALATGVFGSVASAQPVRTFVASTGTDANACSLFAPCRTLQRGIDAVAASGDVLIMDSGEFGSNVMITKSVSVFAPPGGQSRLTVSNGTAITVDGGGITVSISYLGITSLTRAGRDNGVNFQNGAAVSLTGMDININNFSNGVLHYAGGGHLMLFGTVIRNGGSCLYAPGGTSGSPTRTTIVNSYAENCGDGFFGYTYSNVSIRDSSVNCRNDGSAYIAAEVEAVMTLDNVVATNCNTGVISFAGGTITISNSLITGNDFAGALGIDGGIGRTYGNNRIFGNGNNMLSGFTPIAEQ